MISQDEPTGYAYVEVCYQCTNSYPQTIEANIWIKQKINCAIALTSPNATSKFENYNFPTSGSEHESVSYNVGSSHAATSYTTPTTMFNNVNFGDCSGFTTCILMAPDCAAAYSGSGYAAMDTTTFAITIRQDIADGYTEDLCVKCTNLAGSTTTSGSWTIKQKRNCATALSVKGSPHPN